MALMRTMLLAAAQNIWLREHAVKYPFVKRSVSRFMPGETLEDALIAAQSLRQKGVGSVFTHLGENVADRNEARQVTEHYLQVLDRIHQSGLATEVSVKLTQLGLDLSPDLCAENLEQIIGRENNKESTVWVDMEASNYVDATLDIYKRALKRHPNLGICLQSYLYRTKKDLADMLPLRPSIRLVKGAYKEPPDVAFPKKADVDANYFALAQDLLRAKAAGQCPAGCIRHARYRVDWPPGELRQERRLHKFRFRGADALWHTARRAGAPGHDGHRSVVLVAYGTYWYPWFVRRLAERPANLWFMLRNVFAS